MRGNGWVSAARAPALLGIDLAANSVTSVVTDLAGRVLAKAGARVVLSRPRPGWVEADPLDWLAAAIVTTRRAVHEAGVRPRAIGLSGPKHGLVLVDAEGLPHVVASIGALPARLPLTGEIQICRAATDRGWCITAPVAAQPGTDDTTAVSEPGRVRRLAHDIATAVRSVSTLAPVSQLLVPGPGPLLAILAELVDRPVHAADAPDPAARPAALLGARAAGLLNEETLRAQFSSSTRPTVEPQNPEHPADPSAHAGPRVESKEVNS